MPLGSLSYLNFYLKLRLDSNFSYGTGLNDGKPLLDAEPEHPAALAYLEIAKIIHPTHAPVLPPETLENNEQISS